MIQRVLIWLANRLREPSTWAGLASLGVVLGFTTEQWQAYAHAGAGLAALVAMLLGENT